MAVRLSASTVFLQLDSHWTTKGFKAERSVITIDWNLIPHILDRKAQIGQFPRRSSSSIATNRRTRLASSVPTLVLPGNFSLKTILPCRSHRSALTNNLITFANCVGDYIAPLVTYAGFHPMAKCRRRSALQLTETLIVENGSISR